jgi:hypothetical protein
MKSVERAQMSKCHGAGKRVIIFLVISIAYDVGIVGTAIAYYMAAIIKKEDLKMLTLWIVMGCLFMTGIGIRFTYKVLGLTPAEAVAVFVFVVALVGVNTAPAKVFLMSLF